MNEYFAVLLRNNRLLVKCSVGEMNNRYFCQPALPMYVLGCINSIIYQGLIKGELITRTCCKLTVSLIYINDCVCFHQIIRYLCYHLG